ncbi:MAG: ferric reductase-like transmembrane domain-containing protein [Acidobacteriota bacterium]|nr:ferric reductase-like transmembrane domain-containing protein [Acidobacteriota bacterium]
MTAIDLSSYVALLALALLSINILLGLLISVRYSPLRSWPHRQINIFALHNWTGYTALCVAGLHPALLLFSSTAGFRWFDLLWPLHSPSQPLVNSLGAAAFYCLAVVVTTSYFRIELGRKTWKRLHYTAYAAAALFFTHGIFTDPELKNRPTDFLDGEKVFIEVCLLIVLAAIALRVRYALKKQRRA